MQNLKAYLKLFLKGMAMGGADVVPGVSGGTIAFITGIYETLLNAIKSFDVEAVQMLAKFRIADFWRHVNGSFLVTLLSGILLSIFTLVQIISYLLEAHPVQLWSFFFGLIIIAAILVFREIKVKTGPVILAAILGAIAAFLITQATPAQTPEEWWFIFIAGAIAICAMILPGISGSFLLLLLGKYTFILHAVKDGNLLVIVMFAIGCAVGLLSFARLISWFLERYHDLTVAVLAGIMIGSLNKIWPWKEVVSYRINSAGERKPLIEENVWPAQYQEITGHEPYVLQAILFAAIGLILVFALDRIARVNQQKIV